MLLKIATALTLPFAAAAAPAGATFLNRFNATNAGFLSLFNNLQGSDVKGSDKSAAPSNWTLIATAFSGNPLVGDSLNIVENPLSSLNANTQPVVSSLTSEITWPNDQTVIQSGSIGSYNGLLVAGGFLVPPKTVGGVYALTGAALDVATKLSVDKGSALDGWFYHRALQRDVDGDGNIDIITARATKPLFAPQGGELVWLKNPGGADPLAPTVTPWQESTLYNGSFSPDVFFRLTQLRGASDPDEQLVYTSFFTGGGLALLICKGCNNTDVNTWSNTTGLVKVIVDNTIGPAFDLEVVDLNGDGRLDLLVTNHVANATLSGVYAYEAPIAPTPLTQVSAWKKHTLASGFITREPGFPGSQASPGSAQSMSPCVGSTVGNGKPLITLSGDGDQRFYILSAQSSDPTDWSYDINEIFDCAGTAGRQAAQDIDNDGCPEIFLSCYDNSTIAVMRLDK